MKPMLLLITYTAYSIGKKNKIELYMDINLNSDTNYPLNIFDEINKLGVNPIIIVISLVIIILYIILFGALGSGSKAKDLLSNGPGDSGDVNVLEIILWSVLVLLVLINGLQYFFGVNIVASLQNLFTKSFINRVFLILVTDWISLSNALCLSNFDPSS